MRRLRGAVALISLAWLARLDAQLPPGPAPPPGVPLVPNFGQPLAPPSLAPGPAPLAAPPAVVAPPVVEGPGVVAAPPPPSQPASLFGDHEKRFRAEPGKPLPYPSLAIQIVPGRVVAPVGSEVVLLAGVTGKDGKLRPGEPIEWVLEPGGVGHFVAMNEAHHAWYKPKDFRKDATYATTRASFQRVALTRGTPTIEDDVLVQAGQAWISVTSAIEGASLVTAIGPDIYGWPERQQTATIHWIDAAFQLPPPAINPVGTRHIFTTVVARHSDNSPLVGWKVRYEIVDGPPAVFGNGAGQVAEVITNDLGQASVEIAQAQPAPGTNRVRIDIIRPARAATGAPGDLLVSSGATMKTWTSPNLQADIVGPPQAAVGARVAYTIEVANRGDLPTRDATVALDIPSGGAFLDSAPPAEAAGGRPTWRLGDLAAGERRVIQFNAQFSQPGNPNVCVQVTSADGLAAQDCATTAVLPQSVELVINGPDTAAIGQIVPFTIVVTNRGATPVPDLLVVDRPDPGLVHATITTGAIERDIGTLAPGQSITLPLELRVVNPGRLCHRVEVLPRAPGAASTPLATAEKCVEVGGSQPAALSVTKTGPPQADVGQLVDFVIDVRNDGAAPLTDLTVIDQYDASLKPELATEGAAPGPQQITWRIAGLQPGQSLRLRVQCRCVERSARACNRVTVRANPPVEQAAEACLEIRQPEVKLGVSIVDSADPIARASTTDYVVRVKNNGASSETNVVLTVALGAGLVAVPLGTEGPPGVPMAIENQGATVRFAPLRELRPGEEVTYRVRARGDQPGRVSVKASVISAAVSMPVTAEGDTTINP